ncbi:MAG: branched-chain amino acid ABC transporter permease [Chloroflexi bacterium]|nr:branched-chain amino acid ABC transporter permease [Chloroflexota bacterium]
MIWEQLAGNLTQGLVLGSVYGVATMGLSLIFGVLRVVNVGHGSFMMVGAFVALIMFASWGLVPVLAIVVALALGMALGYAVFYAVMRRLIRAPELASLLATFALGIILQEVVRVLFGAEWRGYTWDIGSIDLGITVMPVTKILALVGSTLTAAFLYVWFSKTKAGTAVRAVVEDSEGAKVCGINVTRTYALSFAIGIGITVMSGVMLALFTSVGINPYMGGPFTLKAFVIAVLGGLTSPYGAFFAGLIFGLIENGSYVLLALIPDVEPFALTRFVTFVMLLVILLFKPTGLLGAK